MEGIMAEDPYAPTQAERYGTWLLAEEGAEILEVFALVLKLLGKGGRFGLDTPGMKDPLTGVVDMTVTPRGRLADELGDLMAAAEYMGIRGIVDKARMTLARDAKLQKLLDPNSRDNLGRQLAP